MAGSTIPSFITGASPPRRRGEALRLMNASYEAVQTALPQLRSLLLTYGTAYVYRLAGDEYGGVAGRVVSNCHKLPERTFVRERVSLGTLLQTWRPLIERLRERFPELNDHSDGEPRASSA